MGLTKEDDQPFCHAQLVKITLWSFQSIGVNSDWRHRSTEAMNQSLPKWFPINRCHQGLATSAMMA
jgi:hypothetical protein